MSGTTLKKRLFINCDGTGQAEYTKAPKVVSGYESSPEVSNVARIGRATVPDDHANGFSQIVYYQTGVGADAETGGGLGQSGWGTGLVSNVRTAYGFICNNYDYGDEIYITGFSRGAFTARSVAGLIGRCGILTKRGLNLFYEVIHYYRYYSDFTDEKRPPCPVSEDDLTSRFFIPGTKKRISIKAVGVWDTVGALHSDMLIGGNVKWRYHNLELGDHIENAYHMMALNEHRYWFDATLWESPTKRSWVNFEQCWMPGDHSNIGGSWDDQQISDMALAWMMGRFASLGAKFEYSYLYGEFLKYKNYVQNIAPYLPYDKAANNPYPKDLNPRTWGQGRIHNIWADTGVLLRKPSWGNATSFNRTPGQYRQAVWSSSAADDSASVTTGKFLQNTNETMHRLTRYRKICDKAARLGYNDLEPFDPGALSGEKWTWPSPTEPTGCWYYQRDEDKQKISIPPSTLTWAEQIYLAFYNLDPYFQKKVSGKEEDIWKQNLYSDISSDVVKRVGDIISRYKELNPDPVGGAVKPRVGPGIYCGSRPLLTDDFSWTTSYEYQAQDIKMGTWIGDDLVYANSYNSQGERSFSCLDEIVGVGKLIKLEASLATNPDAIREFKITYDNKYVQSVCVGVKPAKTLQAASPAAFEVTGKKIIKVEFKASEKPATNPQPTDTGCIVGIKCTTATNDVWKVPSTFDTLQASRTMSESAPMTNWSLRGFYGAYANGNVIRIGCIWGSPQGYKA